jgi:hypothetical protein
MPLYWLCYRHNNQISAWLEQSQSGYSACWQAPSSAALQPIVSVATIALPFGAFSPECLPSHVFDFGWLHRQNEALPRDRQSQFGGNVFHQCAPAEGDDWTPIIAGGSEEVVG